MACGAIIRAVGPWFDRISVHHSGGVGRLPCRCACPGALQLKGAVSVPMSMGGGGPTTSRNGGNAMRTQPVAAGPLAARIDAGPTTQDLAQ